MNRTLARFLARLGLVAAALVITAPTTPAVPSVDHPINTVGGSWPTV